MTKPTGRPTIFDANATDRVAVTLTPGQLEELRRVARERHLSMSTIIRAAVNRLVGDSGEPRVFVRRK